MNAATGKCILLLQHTLEVFINFKCVLVAWVCSSHANVKQSGSCCVYDDVLHGTEKVSQSFTLRALLPGGI